MTEQEELELREQAEWGRKAKAAREIFEYFILRERANEIYTIEKSDDVSYESLLFPKVYLRVLRKLEGQIQYFLDNGEIAEKELSNNGK